MKLYVCSRQGSWFLEDGISPSGEEVDSEMAPFGNSENGGGWRLGSVKDASDNVVGFVADLLARHGWTAILLFVVWYNCKDPAKRRYRQWSK